MISVACSGFPVPTSRYFREFAAVEISDTELGIPGDGTRRRWLREAEPGFVFTVLAPKMIANAGFELNADTKRAIDEVASFAKDLSARAVVFAASEAFVPTRDNRAVLKKLVTHLERKLPNAVLDLPGWPMKELDALLDKSKLTIAFDPLGEEPAKLGKLAYLRLPGPSGYRSRYDAAALDRVVSYCNACKASDVMLVLRNIDRYENGKYVAKHLEVAER